jgi:hypothetical protein
MAVKGVCWIKACQWNADGTGVDIHIGIVSVDPNLQIENEYVIVDASPSLSRASIVAAARDEMVNTYGLEIGVSDTVVLIPPAI